MADEYPWCRWYNEVIGDPKLEHVARRSNVPFITVLGAWGMILAMASRSPKRGSLMLSDTFPYEHRDILDKLSIPEANEILDAFFGLGLLEQDEEGVIVISHWDKRQPSSDNSAQRQRDHRARKQQSAPTKTVTTLSRDKVVTVTPSDIDTDTDTDQYTHTTRPREAEPDLPPEPDGLWGDDLAEDLKEVVDAAAPDTDFVTRIRALSGVGVPSPQDEKEYQVMNTAAAYVWLSVTKQWVGVDRIPEVVRRLGPDPDVIAMTKAWHFWYVVKQFRRQDLTVLDWYDRLRDDPEWTPDKELKKARASPKSKTNGVTKAANGKPDDFDWDSIGQVL